MAYKVHSLKEKQRDSNFELLRIISMFLVCMLHVNIIIKNSIEASTIEKSLINLYSCGIDGFSIVAVNVFVLISGWYGIKFRIKGLYSFLFQVFFYYLGLTIILHVFDIQVVNTLRGG